MCSATERNAPAEMRIAALLPPGRVQARGHTASWHRTLQMRTLSALEAEWLAWAEQEGFLRQATIWRGMLRSLQPK